MLTKTRTYDYELAISEEGACNIGSTLSTCDINQSIVIVADRNSFIIINVVGFICEMSRGILFPTLLLNIQRNGGTLIDNGFAVAAFSLGRVIFGPIVGTLSETYGYKTLLILTLLVSIIGTTFYANASSVRAIILAQFIIGTGASNVGAVRAYVCENTRKDERSKYIAILTSAQFAGVAVAPFITYGIVFIASMGHERLNNYSLPAYIAAISSAVIIYFLFFYFKDVHRAHNHRQDEVQSILVSSTENEEFKEVEQESASFSFFTISFVYRVGGCLLNVGTKGSIAVYETLGIGIAVSFYNWSSQEAGLLFATSGSIGVIVLILLQYNVKYFNDLQVTVFGLVMMILACSFLIKPPVGSGREFFASILIMYAIGYPVAHTGIISLVSKISNKAPVGALMGWFSAAGSLSRILFPILAGGLSSIGPVAVSSDQDYYVIFEITTIVLVVAAVAVVCGYKSISKNLDL